MLNHLEATIQKIISESAAAMADQIAQSVRQSLATEIMGASASAFSAAKISMPAAMSAAPKRRGRPPGSGKKAAAPVVHAAPAVHAPPAAPAAKVAKAAPAGKKTRKGFKRRSIAQHELDQVLSILAKKPGLSSVQIQKEAGIDKAQAARVLTKLRGTKKVSLKGKRSKATYSVA
jgi:hypothetical protein